ncbi:hypothetical protein CRG98_003958 [Punica granatum]|uniref:Uncharacterized protein n=1 Tax=Punica granatum TaxID=22663 RepID=A0A2I0L4T2_PUNGR|nr:hypothetical protein CRG98_003958 [Punica granatum]
MAKCLLGFRRVIAQMDSEIKNRKGRGSGLPIGDPEPSTEGVGTHRGHRRPRWRGRGRRLVIPTPNLPRTPSLSPRLIQGWGRQSATRTPPPRAPTPTKNIGTLGGGFEVSDWRP